MNFTKAQHYLLGLGHETLSMKLGLENVRTLLDALSNPQAAYPSVHIAGTNGKGSVAAMIESIARAAGIRTGLFTSPHLASITERIRISGIEIPESEFARITSLIVEKVQSLRGCGQLNATPTFFEHITAIAMLFFRERGVELGIFEVGLGGRLDSTNVLEPLVSVITSVDLDHQQYLGTTLAEIANEKAGILKPGRAAVLAPQHAEASAVIEETCVQHGLRPLVLDEKLAIEHAGDGHYTISFSGGSIVLQNVVVGLRGKHQAVNAATAMAAVSCLIDAGMGISPDAVRKGIETVEWPGRLEILKRDPAVLLDGAHNPSGARMLREFLRQHERRPLVILFAVMADKDIESMAQELFPLASTLVLTKLPDGRAATLERLQQAGSLYCQSVALVQDVRRALEAAMRACPAGGLVVVTGSLHLVGAVRKLLAAQPAGFE